MRKSNIHKKQSYEDKFARKFYPQRSAKKIILFEKKQQSKTIRKIAKREIMKALTLLSYD